MRHIHLFNPENDLALASGLTHYTPPPNARLLHDAGAALPLWYGDKGDKVIMSDSHRPWVDYVTGTFNLGTGIFLPEECTSGYAASPWGWSENARQQFINAGVSTDILPDSDKIAGMRRLSHRRITIEIISRLSETLGFKIPDIPFEAYTVTDVENYIRRHPGCYIKLPWSSSGRGVINSASLPDAELLRRCCGMIKRQGSVLCEPGLDKILDFAMLFECNGKRVVHSGYSSFFTDHGTAYSGNIVTDDSTLYRLISRHIQPERLNAVSEALSSIFSDIIAPYYHGAFGVDMMLYRDNGKISIAPCVEVNLRMTMGIVARRLKRLLAPHGNAIFRVGYGTYPYQTAPPVIENGNLVRGCLSLIPECRDFFITLCTYDSSEPFKFAIQPV
ncbi:MAG: hypothetical protein IJY31_08725 [Muribaculaceae bacterium]|nr:hypothetical protein [Muribaculaceae bacterium]